MALVKPVDETHEGFLRDESRTQGSADTVSQPTDEAEVREVFRELGDTVPVTVQGARTGLAAGCVPFGGHVMSLQRMNSVLGLSGTEEQGFRLRVQPGVVLQDLRAAVAKRSFDTTGWDDGSLAALDRLRAAAPVFFPCDPTETSATVGGMVACNASGARSYRYGAMRRHVTGLRAVLGSGETLALSRGEVRAQGHRLLLTTEQGTSIEVPVPAYAMPEVKNASGYFACANMDAVDLFVGSDGTLGVITEVELGLLRAPAVVWGVNCFFDDEDRAVDFVEAVRRAVSGLGAVEYFDPAALDILRSQRHNDPAFSSLPEVGPAFACCVFVELQADGRDGALASLAEVGRVMTSVGADPGVTWVGTTDVDRERQRFFRHAVPESVNMLIDERRRTDPSVTKLGSDMAVPDGHLKDVVALYRCTLAEEGLESATWGHIGDNHLHVNVLPRNAEEHARGKALFSRWAAEVSAMGGTVSAEHGVGKIKRDFLLDMYGEKGVAQMAAVKRALDPAGVLGRGNLFDERLLEGGEA
ncbi:FAD-binding oxidoreductase [Atopobiaceae bacterium 24-176]